ncbi:hypothetical protein M23134_04737 [Microscilla marina ATCC 23134]|uniref:Uncharacterized protein n=1 Tax=Microscilla marina ATCC 23134 TaxID=313606 RepID=A1ZRF9_MICM2|nr:hypothetical protein M23134_04737 [Microscilla marina ATCC 23134]
MASIKKTCPNDQITNELKQPTQAPGIVLCIGLGYFYTHPQNFLCINTSIQKHLLSLYKTA